jgi:hypothetical protein
MTRAAKLPIAIPIIALEGKPVLVEGVDIGDEEVDVEEYGVDRVAVGDELEVVRGELAVTVYRNGRISDNAKNELR